MCAATTVDSALNRVGKTEGNRQMAAVRIASVGDCCIDSYAGNDAAVGGNALNVAVHLVRLGFETEFIGVVGDDARGDRIRAALARVGVHADRVHVRPGATW